MRKIERQALGTILVCTVALMLVLQGTGMCGYFLGYDEVQYKRAVLDVCVEVVSPSLRDYLVSFNRDALVTGVSRYSKKTAQYPRFQTKEGLAEEIAEVYRVLSTRLRPRYREEFHYNNVIQLGIMADLVLRYVGCEPGMPIFFRWKGAVMVGNDPVGYLHTLEYGGAEVDTAVNAVANLWLSAWGDSDDAKSVGYSVRAVAREEESRISTIPFMSGGTYEPIGSPERPPCPQPYIDSLFPRSGTAGDTVFVRGARFGRERGQVVFPPRVSADVLSWSHRRIEVTVPEGAASGPVTVKVSCGAISNGKVFSLVGGK